MGRETSCVVDTIMFYPQFPEGRTFVPDAESVGGLGKKSFQLSALVRVGLSCREHLVRPYPLRRQFDALIGYLWRVLYPTSVGLAKARSDQNRSLTSASTPLYCLLLPLLGKYPAPKSHVSISFQTTQLMIWGKLLLLLSHFSCVRLCATP